MAMPPVSDVPTQDSGTPQQFKQITVSEAEKKRLEGRIHEDFMASRSNHDARIYKFRRIFRMWRGLEVQARGPDGPRFEVPMIKWITLGAWAKAMSALLGDDAEIIAKPTAPSDSKDAVKAGHYMTWRVFTYMQAVIALTTFVFRGILFGRAHAEVLYEQEYYWERGNLDDVAKQLGCNSEDVGEKLDSQGLDWKLLPDGRIDYEQLSYDGPRLIPLWPSDLILPAQDSCQTIDDFEWVGRRRRYTPQQLLDGERRGKFQGITENWEQISSHAQQRQERDYWYDDEKIDADQAEGVDHTAVLGNRDSVECWEWYMRWRLPKGNADARLNNLKRRNSTESELLVKYLPKVGLIVGIQDLRDLYPRMKKRNPFIDIGIIKDGTYWTPGLGELLEDLQDESSINHQLFREAGMFSVGPLIFYKPGGAFDPNVTEYRPRTAIPTANPQDVNVVSMKADLTYSEAMGAALKGMAELVTGHSDQSLGQSSDRPNAPRTASGQAMLINEGNVRASLDMTMLREDFGRLVSYVWALDREYADDEVFFRVTDEDAGSLYDENQGFGKMTAEERAHPYDFDVKFATSIFSREAKKAAMLQLYQLSLANPILQQNPRALWVLLNRVWEAFGEKTFSDIIPQPPEIDQPKQPKEEWEMLAKGDQVDPNPQDDDKAHLLDHRRRLEMALAEPGERQNPRLIAAAKAHIIATEQQVRRKMLVQALVQRAMEEAQAQQAQPQQPGIPGAPSSAGAPGQPLPGQVPPVQLQQQFPPAPAGPGGPIKPAEQGMNQ